MTSIAIPRPAGRTATVIVAAADSRDRHLADFECDGSDDDVKIQAAINALPDLAQGGIPGGSNDVEDTGNNGRGGGGTVLLLAGTYSLSASIEILYNNITLCGEGAGTVLKLAAGLSDDTHAIKITQTGSGLINRLFNITVQDLSIDGNEENQTSTALDGIFADETDGNGMHYFQFSGLNIHHCSRHGISIDTLKHSNIRGNFIQYNDGHGILSTGSHTINFVGNQINWNRQYGIYMLDGKANVVSGNGLVWNGINGNVAALRIQGPYVTVTGNQLIANYGWGAVCPGMRHSTICGNTFRNNGQGADDTFPQLRLTSDGGTDAEFNSIGINIFQAGTDLGPNRPNYGISEAAASADNNAIVGNTFDGHATGAAQITGASTIVRSNIGLADN